MAGSRPAMESKNYRVPTELRLTHQLTARHFELVSHPVFVERKIQGNVEVRESLCGDGGQPVDVGARRRYAIMQRDLDGEDIASHRPSAILGAVIGLALDAIAKLGM